MQTISGVHNLGQSLEQSAESSVVTIGNFDGVHSGHRSIIEKVVGEAKKRKSQSIVMTFSPHPRQVLQPDQPFYRIFDFEDQKKSLEEFGVDILIVEPFSRSLSEVSAEKFIQEWVFSPLNMAKLIVGYDFTFGADRKGSLEVLTKLSQKLGFELEVVPPLEVNGVVASSSKIRNAVCEHDMILANELLGRPFYLAGIVEKGDGRGRTIGIPTVNLHTEADLVPKTGVYSSWLTVSDKKYAAVTNIGRNPTFNSPLKSQVRIETHIFDFDEDIYGKTIKLEFCSWIRDEIKFTSVDDLVKQIHEDMNQAREQLKKYDEMG